MDVNAGTGCSPRSLTFKRRDCQARGPVGLSAAHDLALMLATAVTIFEAAQVAGEAECCTSALPEYRLPRDVVEAQVREILATGDITLKLESRGGRGIFTVADLRYSDFDAVLILTPWVRIAAANTSLLPRRGVTLTAFTRASTFCLNVNLGYRFTIGKTVVVIGGGNVAMDVARSAAREVLKQHAGGVEQLEPLEEQHGCGGGA